MNGPSQGERDFKLSKESAYRQLLKEQMEEGRRAKEAEKAKKKAVQEQELRELLQFEQTNVKKISNDKKILAMGEFGGQSVKSMLYNEEKGKEEEKQYQQPPIQNVVEPEPQQPYYAPQEPRQSQPQQPQQPQHPIYVPPQPVAAIGGISALLNKSQQNPYSAAPAAVTALVAEAPAIKIREVFVDNPELIEKAEKFEELNSLYTDLLQNQQTMKRVLEENTNKMKRVADNEKSKMKTLMAGQRGGESWCSETPGAGKQEQQNSGAGRGWEVAQENPGAATPKYGHNGHHHDAEVAECKQEEVSQEPVQE